MADDGFADLQRRLRAFAAERDWEQYHTPKNLVMALAAEVGELLDLFQWMTPTQSSAIQNDPDAMAAIGSELADVTIYLVRLADVLSVDLIDAAHVKTSENEVRFRADNRGHARLRHIDPNASGAVGT